MDSVQDDVTTGSSGMGDIGGAEPDPSSYYSVIPHPALPLGTVRPRDIYYLLALGAAFEIIGRIILLLAMKKSRTIVRKENEVKLLAKETKQKRDLGPSAFVETSKLERQLLAAEKELMTLTEQRKETAKLVEKRIQTFSTILTVCVFFIYYGIPIVELDGYQVAARNGVIVQDTAEADTAAVSVCQAFLFPIGYLGVGVKISRWGLPNPKASVGALMVFWSSQVTVRQIMDGVDALVLGRKF